MAAMAAREQMEGNMQYESLRTYHVFVSHAWSYDSDYTRLVDMLNSAARFVWKNYSCPQCGPAVDTNSIIGYSRLVTALENQIRPVQCVVVLSGMYVAHSRWIQKEIDIATGWSKPIIGVVPWGAERTPTAVSSVAKEMVRWNTESIVAAIRKWSL
jgi:hypothetical protein